MQIKYVGVKDEETAFSPETGITWYPGSSHAVAPAIAKRMLQHPDVFAEDKGTAEKVVTTKTAAPVTTPAPAPAPDTTGGSGTQTPPDGNPPEFVMGTPDGPLVLDTIEREELVGLAKELGITHHVNLGAPKLRALLVEKQPFKAQ